MLALYSSQDGQVQILLIGVIKKVDAKTNAVTVTERIYPERRGGRRGLPGPDLGPGFPPAGPRGPRGGDQVDTKVFYSAETIIKASDKELAIDELKPGDSVRVTGTPTNKGIVAKEIYRIKAGK